MTRIVSSLYRPLNAVMLLALFSFGCATTPRATPIGSSKFVGESKVHRYRLSNGLKVLILEDHSSPTFAYHTWFDVGSKDEQKGLTGLAHLFEHMMFKETKNLKDGQFDRQLEAAGAEGENAFTSRDYTGYIQSLPSDKLDLIARLEADRMHNLLVDEKALDTEREVVQNERRFRKENSPDGQLYERLFQLAYTKHSYQWPVIGYEADLIAAKKGDAEAFYKRFYAPNNANIIIVGDVDPDKTMTTITKYYGHLPTSKIDRHEPNKEPEQRGERTDTKALKIQVPKLMMAFHIVDLNHPDFPVLEVLRDVLTTGKGSRLQKKLIDGGIATEVDIENTENRYPGLFVFFVNMQKGKTAEQAQAVIEQEINSIINGRVSASEISSAIAMHRFQTYDGLASNYRKAYFLGLYETVATRFERGIEILDALKSVSSKDLARVARTYLKKDNRTVVIGVPGGK